MPVSVFTENDNEEVVQIRYSADPSSDRPGLQSGVFAAEEYDASTVVFHYSDDHIQASLQDPHGNTSTVRFLPFVRVIRNSHASFRYDPMVQIVGGTGHANGTIAWSDEYRQRLAMTVTSYTQLKEALKSSDRRVAGAALTWWSHHVLQAADRLYGFPVSADPQTQPQGSAALSRVYTGAKMVQMTLRISLDAYRFRDVELTCQPMVSLGLDSNGTLTADVTYANSGIGAGAHENLRRVIDTPLTEELHRLCPLDMPAVAFAIDHPASVFAALEALHADVLRCCEQIADIGDRMRITNCRSNRRRLG